MNSRQAIVAGLVLAGLAVAWWLNRPAFSRPALLPTAAELKHDSAAASKPKEASGSTVSVASAGPHVQPPGTAPPPVNPAPATRTVYMPPEPAPPEGFDELQSTSRMLTDYRQIMGENPVGNNAEIMKSLMGGNSKGAMLGPPKGMELNSNGELVDRRGTPIFFHALSNDRMEIRSAGPDRAMWTGDDVVFR